MRLSAQTHTFAGYCESCGKFLDGAYQARCMLNLQLWNHRESKTVPAKAHVAISRSPARQQVAITMQDASLGATAIMRIAALFDKPDEPSPMPTASAAAAAAVAASAAMSHASQSHLQAAPEEASAPLPEPRRQKQFSLHIIRCNCILKIAAARRTSKARLGTAQPSLVLDVPDFSLQLPPSCPCALLAPFPAEHMQLRQAAELHFNAEASGDIVGGSSLRLMLTSSGEADAHEPLLSVPAVSATLPHDLAVGHPQQCLCCRIPSIVSDLDVKKTRMLASLVHSGLQDWRRLSLVPESEKRPQEPLHPANVPLEPALQAPSLPFQIHVDSVKLRLLPRSSDQHILLLTCKSLALRWQDVQDYKGKKGNVAFSKLQLEYSLSDHQSGPAHYPEPIRSGSPEDEFMQPSTMQLGRTFSAPLGSDMDAERLRRSKRLTRRHSRDSPTFLSRPRSGLLEGSATLGMTASSSHSGSFSNMPGLKRSRDETPGDRPVSGLLSRRVLPSMVRAPSRLNKWLQQLPASHEDQTVGHGLTAAFYGAGSSSGSIGDVTEILDPADLEHESAAGSIWDLGEGEPPQESPAFEHALLLSIEGSQSAPTNLDMVWKKSAVEHQLDISLSFHMTLFAQVNCWTILQSCSALSEHVQ